jgi:hypothetical protein
MVKDERSGSLRYGASIIFLVGALAFVGSAVLTLFSHETDSAPSKSSTVAELVAAYAHIQPGLTPASQLARLGFETGADRLSYLAVLEHFMPRDSVAFDRLDAAVRECVDARDRCTAMVFRATAYAQAPPGRGLVTELGLGVSAAVRMPQVTLLIRDGRVAFKSISGISAAVTPKSDATPVEVRTMVVAIRPKG